MKNTMFLIFFMSIWNIHFLNAQTPGEWTWMAGSNSNCTSVYGTQGVSSPLNTPGDAYEAACWTDINGDLWLFGGMDGSQKMWKYDINTNMWTWMSGPVFINLGSQMVGPQGVYSSLSLPGSTGLGKHAEWVDSNGDFWLFSGDGYYPDVYSMWKYSRSLNLWAFMHGNIPINFGTIGIPDPTVQPLIEESPISWSDSSGNLWLYNGEFSILFKYDIGNNVWTRMHGDLLPTPSSISDNTGQFSDENRPKNGAAYQHWTSVDGTFYMFGPGPNRNESILTLENAMWQFSPFVNQWRVVHGGDINNSASFIGNCSFSLTNHPSNITEQRACWQDACNRFYGIDEGSGGYIWCFDPLINQYALIEGNVEPFLTPIAPVFGIQGISNTNNIPGTLPFTGGDYFGAGGPFWTDNSGNFWELGMGSCMFFPGYSNNALWRYCLDYSCIGFASASFTPTPAQGCSPLTVDFIPNDTTNTLNFHWDFGVQTESSDTSNFVSPSYTFVNPGTYTVQLIVDGTGKCGSGSDTSEIQITVVSPPELNLNKDTTICKGTIVSLSAFGANSYTWSPATSLNSSTGTEVIASPLNTTNYSVSGTISGCTVTDSILVTVNPLPTITLDNLIVLTYGDSTQLFASGGETYSWQPPTGLSCTDCPNPIVQPEVPTQYTVTVTDSNGCVNTKTVFVNINTDGCLYIPNIFSPNKDLTNDQLCLYGSCLKSGTFTIYNRWGEKVFETTDINTCWDGTYKGEPVGSDIFVYKLDGILVTGEVVEESGNIEVVR